MDDVKLLEKITESVGVYFKLKLPHTKTASTWLFAKLTLVGVYNKSKNSPLTQTDNLYNLTVNIVDGLP